MGGGSSRPTPPPAPTVVNQPAPKDIAKLTNLSLAPGTTSACNGCALLVDAQASTSSVKLAREFGDITREQGSLYETKYTAVANNQMSVSDFLGGVQAGTYVMPFYADSAKRQPTGYYREIRLSEEVAKDIKTIDDYNRSLNQGKYETVRIRKESGAGGFSSGTKAKLKLSIPIKITYSDGVRAGTAARSSMQRVGGRWAWTTTSAPQQVPDMKSSSISSLTLYHPSPIRIENVQHDAVLSLNDPSDPTANVIVLVPLKSSNTTDASTLFFSKITRYISSIASPNPATGQYPEVDIPTGNDWNVKNIFWLDKKEKRSDNLSRVTDAYFTWKGATTYSPTTTRGSGTITNSWRPDKEVRYFMLANPVSIGASDLSALTQSLPPTPTADAIHGIPDPAATNVKIAYKTATSPASNAGCGVVRERMTNQGPGDILASAFGGDTSGMLVDERGQPLADKDSCDPFANNAKKVSTKPSLFTPSRFLSMFFNILIFVAVALGAWLALYFVADKDYDVKYKEFSETAGKVVGKLALQASASAKEARMGVGQGLSSLTNLVKQGPSGASSTEGVPIPKGVEKLAGLFGKKA